MTESVALDRHVVYIICTYSIKKPITFPGGTNSLEYSMETCKQPSDPRTNNQYSHTCLYFTSNSNFNLKSSNDCLKHSKRA